MPATPCVLLGMCLLSGWAAPSSVPPAWMLLETVRAAGPRYPSKAGISEKIPAFLQKTVLVAIFPS